jgi:hypothetical protein
MVTKTTVGVVKNESRQPYIPSAQFAEATSVVVVPVFADSLVVRDRLGYLGMRNQPPD